MSGYDIAITYRTANEELENIVKQIEENDVKCFAVQGDVSIFEDCERFVKEIIEEYENDVHCVAAPVLDFMGKVIAGISVSGPKVRMSMERIENEIAPLLIEAAQILSGKFGYMGYDASAE